jgi:HPt (histidine-containing phosphotransfer) domain-containing protein
VDFVIETIGEFFEEIPRFTRDLETALEAGKAADFQRAAHTLKSHCRNLGAVELGRLCAELEALGKAGALGGEARAKAAAIAQVFAAVKPRLEQSREQLRRSVQSK